MYINFNAQKCSQINLLTLIIQINFTLNIPTETSILHFLCNARCAYKSTFCLNLALQSFFLRSNLSAVRDAARVIAEVTSSGGIGVF